jgi:hypothetical protein
MTVGVTVEPSNGPPPVKPNSFARIAGIFFSPVETLQSIARRPDLLVPLVVLLLITIPFGIVIAAHVDFASAAREALESNPDVKPERIARIVEFSQTMGRVMAYSSPVLGIVFLAIVAGVLLISFRLMGGEGEYKQALSVVTYTWFIFVIESVLRSVILVKRGMVGGEQLAALLRSNLAFLTDMKEHPMLSALLSSVDLFNIWVVVLLVIGFSFVSNLSRARSAAIMLTLYGFVVLLKVGGGAMRMLGTHR